MKTPGSDEEMDITRGVETSEQMDDPRLLSAVQEYVAAVESGRRPNRQEFIARHADIASELSVCLQGLAFVNSAMGEINGKDEPPDTMAGQPLGDFKLVREIGRGGMGVVYEAHQLSLDRRVAVKVLPMAAALDPRHLQRFRNEAQAAAQLHHTNIVPVYAVGNERSVHYYAMQLIDGQSLSEVIAELRAVRAGIATPADRSGSTQKSAVSYSNSSTKSAKPLERVNRLGAGSLTLDGRIAPGADSIGNLTSLHSTKRPAYYRTVAKLALQAADALYYAHQQGVVHRDIKPANLLLDGQGILWITDFGLAQMYADTGLTQTGDTLGTFRYMSPEQASGRAVVLDQRTDIYSLGITIYELLTLERALPGQNREELLYQITSVDPKPPRTIDRRIPTELETIIGKAIAKDAAERYPTAHAMAEDLQRFLDDKPVLARRPSVWNKAVKWSRRHRAVTVSTGVVVVLAAAGSSVTSFLLAREQGHTKAAYLLERQHARDTEVQRQKAVKSFDQAREAVDFLTSMAIKELPTEPQFFQVRWRMLEESLAYYQSFLDQSKDDPTRAAQLVAAQAKVSAVLSELSALDDLLRKNFEIRLLTEPSVRRDIHLLPQQADAANTLVSQVASKPPIARPDSTDMTSDQIKQEISQEVSERETALQKVVTPAQEKRLCEISRQIRGVFAFSDGDVAAMMSFTPAQKDAIRSACAEFHNRHHHGPPRQQDDSDPRRPENNSEESDMTAEMTPVRAILTPRQLETWALLVGEPFKGYAPPYELWFAPRHHGPNGDDQGPDGRPFDRDRRGPQDRGPGGFDDNNGPGRRPSGPQNDRPFPGREPADQPPPN